MATQDLANRYVGAQAKIVADARKWLAKAWANLSSDPAAAQRDIIQLLLTLSQSHGPLSAEVAAQYYEAVRQAAEVESKLPAFDAQVVTDVDQDAARSRAAWAAQPMSEGNSTAAFLRADGVVQLLVQRWGRDTTIHNAQRDPARPRFARVPYGKTCAFCRMLAGRGAVYLTAESAGELNSFHADCDCQIVQSYTPNDLPYDPTPYHREYLQARNASGSSDPKAILSQMRKADANRGGVNRNNVKLHQHEIDTGDRLAKLGYDVKFLAPTGKGRFPDIELDGEKWEVKSPQGGSPNTIAAQFRRTHEQSPRIVVDLSRLQRPLPDALLDLDTAFARYTRVTNVLAIYQSADGSVSKLRELRR